MAAKAPFCTKTFSEKIRFCRTGRLLFVSDKQNTERRDGMTFREWIRECLRREAVRTEPDPRKTVQKVMKESKKWKKKN